ncbi:putative protein C17orf105 -like protein [Channa argus]|uniref:Uncharacterized protein n=1 Tax=Channa argus TaxID=215402 RepID=A0A6G1PWJ8_CHAAH|nr:putative protein C17orf105 -like protein [Channa argus]
MALQHRAYQPLFPTGNKYLQQKWDKASYDLHKQKLEEERKMKIKRENNMLMEKISHIMRTTGGVDNKNSYDVKSLGKKKRQLELLRITNENQMILFRLSQCRPHYNVRSWHEDWLKTLRVMDSIARYPRGQEKPSKKSNDAATHSLVTNNSNNKPESAENESS